MMQAEVILFWITVFGYAAAFIFHIFGIVNKKENLIRYTFYILYINIFLHTTVIILHWILTGHSPVTNSFENKLSGTWFIMLIYLIMVKLKKVEKSPAIVITPLVFFLLGYGYLHGIKIKPIGPAYDSPWLAVHVIFAWFAFSSYTIATGAGIILLLKVKNPKSEKFKKMAAINVLDERCYRYVVLGFVNHAVMITAGALWAKKLWGNYWVWDPLEIWSLISFLFYAFYLHARSFLGWKMQKAAYLIIVGLFILIISFFGVGWFGPSPHPL
ncbi:MAG: cytochrome c biogenesis protein CcsA [Spirochaetia bacterium]|nr:cytochrome c biogenesis protein CcsA [Spirochaetia bacterium]